MKKTYLHKEKSLRRKPFAIVAALALIGFAFVPTQTIAKSITNSIYIGSVKYNHTPIEVKLSNRNLKLENVTLYLQTKSGPIKLGTQRLSTLGEAHFCTPQTIKSNSILEVRANRKSVLTKRVIKAHWPQEVETCSLYLAGKAASTAGPQGEQGPQGEPGVAGPAGPTGPQGEQGPQGEPGVPGPAGPVGPKGEQGEQGARGAKGSPGNDGADGADGSDGADGADGLDGVDGIDGVDGQDGAPGDRGLQGLRGVTGATGPAGPKGDIGEPGNSFDLIGEPCSFDNDGTAEDGTYVLTQLDDPSLYIVACDTSLPQ